MAVGARGLYPSVSYLGGGGSPVLAVSGLGYLMSFESAKGTKFYHDADEATLVKHGPGAWRWLYDHNKGLFIQAILPNRLMVNLEVVRDEAAAAARRIYEWNGDCWHPSIIGPIIQTDEDGEPLWVGHLMDGSFYGMTTPAPTHNTERQSESA